MFKNTGLQLPFKTFSIKYTSNILLLRHITVYVGFIRVTPSSRNKQIDEGLSMFCGTLMHVFVGLYF